MKIDYFKESRIFKDESKLFPEYVPPYLPHREEQIKKLVFFFKGLLERSSYTFYRAICHGPVGTGKTVVARFFGKLIEEEAKKKGISLSFIHLNCQIERTYFMIVSKIAESLIPGVPKRGFSPRQYIEWIMDHLEAEDMKILLCLDEADYLIRNDPSALYDLTRIPEIGNYKPRISLLLIMRDLALLKSLSQSISSTLQSNNIKFEPYTSNQIKTILEERVEEAFEEKAVSEDIIEEISIKAGIDKGGKGDARFALELLWRAGKIAEMKDSNMIKPEHLREAMNELHPGISEEILSTLMDEEKILLLAICKAFKRSYSTKVGINEIKDQYNLICELKNRKPKKNTQIWSYLRNLRNKGLINLEVLNAGRGRRSYVSLDIPIEILERRLSENG